MPKIKSSNPFAVLDQSDSEDDLPAPNKNNVSLKESGNLNGLLQKDGRQTQTNFSQCGQQSIRGANKGNNGSRLERASPSTQRNDWRSDQTGLPWREQSWRINNDYSRGTVPDATRSHLSSGNDLSLVTLPKTVAQSAAVLRNSLSSLDETKEQIINDFFSLLNKFEFYEENNFYFKEMEVYILCLVSYPDDKTSNAMLNLLHSIKASEDYKEHPINKIVDSILDEEPNFPIIKEFSGLIFDEDLKKECIYLKKEYMTLKTYICRFIVYSSIEEKCNDTKYRWANLLSLANHKNEKISKAILKFSTYLPNSKFFKNKSTLNIAKMICAMEGIKNIPSNKDYIDNLKLEEFKNNFLNYLALYDSASYDEPGVDQKNSFKSYLKYLINTKDPAVSQPIHTMLVILSEAGAWEEHWMSKLKQEPETAPQEKLSLHSEVDPLTPSSNLFLEQKIVPAATPSADYPSQLPELPATLLGSISSVAEEKIEVIDLARSAAKKEENLSPIDAFKNLIKVILTKDEKTDIDNLVLNIFSLLENDRKKLKEKDFEGNFKNQIGELVSNIDDKENMILINLFDELNKNKKWNGKDVHSLVLDVARVVISFKEFLGYKFSDAEDKEEILFGLRERYDESLEKYKEMFLNYFRENDKSENLNKLMFALFAKVPTSKKRITNLLFYLNRSKLWRNHWMLGKAEARDILRAGIFDTHAQIFIQKYAPKSEGGSNINCYKDEMEMLRSNFGLNLQPYMFIYFLRDGGTLKEALQEEISNSIPSLMNFQHTAAGIERIDKNAMDVADKFLINQMTKDLIVFIKKEKEEKEDEKPMTSLLLEIKNNSIVWQEHPAFKIVNQVFAAAGRIKSS